MFVEDILPSLVEKTMIANALIFIVSCNTLALLELVDGSCLGHTLSKVL
jgi:hypothetical protein